MSIIIKLIGHIIVENYNKYIYEYKLNNIQILSYDIIKTIFCSYGLNEEDFESITVTCDCRNLKNESIIINEDKKVYIYTCNKKIIKDLQDIFITYGHKICLPDTNINNELNNVKNNLDNNVDNNSDNNIDNNSDNNIDNNSDNTSDNNIDNNVDNSEVDFTEINKEAIELFKDTDFIFLIKTYLNKPNLFKVFYKYISSGNIIINKKSKDSNDAEYLSSLQTIKNLGFDFNDEQIIEALKITNNHINLSMRYLLLKKVEENI